jgi:hypothetical protein
VETVDFEGRSSCVRQSAINLLNNTHDNFAVYLFIILLLLFSAQHVPCQSVYPTSTESKSVAMAQPASYTNPLKKFKYITTVLIDTSTCTC